MVLGDVTIVVPDGQTREEWYPLVNDPGLHAAGVEIGARAIFQPQGPPQLCIVFRLEAREWSVDCMHVAVYAGPIESLPNNPTRFKRILNIEHSKNF